MTRSFRFLNVTQFFGALNDNVFKMLIIFALINIQGIEFSDRIVAFAGAIFVIPFLLFSTYSGALSDYFSKRNIIISTKALEVAVMLTGTLAFILRNEIMIYSTLFMMATQSTVFGPAKYGIIPEIVPEKSVLRANSIITMFTYIAIIVGTFFATFITDLSSRNFVLGSLFCVLIALIGLGTSFGVEKTIAIKSKKKAHVVFLIDIVKTMKECLKFKHLALCIYGGAFFLFVGAFV